MKKKLVVLILLLALVTSILFTGCTFIRKNDERISNSVLATVSYDYAGNEYFPKQSLSLNVTRSELMSYINYVIYLYNNYNMQYDPKDVFESSIDSLVTQKYQILVGMAYLMNNSSAERRAAMYYFTDSYKEVYGDKIIPEGLLTIAERYSTIATTNESFTTSIEQYVEDYYSEIRELSITTAKESLASYYAAGYAVDTTDIDNDGKGDGVRYAHLNEDGKTYTEGLYLSQVSADRTTQIDYKKVYLKITLVKTGEENAVVYLPVGKDDVAVAEDDKNTSKNAHITNKVASSDFDEPKVTTEEVTDEKTGKKTTKDVTTYTKHTAVASFKVINPRTSFTESEDEKAKAKDKEPNMLDTYRYFTSFDTNDAKQKEFYDNGQIFDIAPLGLDDATKDAYRRFREEKKNALINFTTEKDPYNGLGYYYKSSFESAILTNVQFELKQAALAADPIDDADLQKQYAILAAKQKQEYDILGNKEQVDKFATTIGTDLSTCYYIPLDALKNTTYKYKDASGVEQTRAYATLNGDGTYTIDMFYITHVLFKFDEAIKTIIDRYISKDLKDEDDIKQAKLDLILSVGLLNTNKSNENFSKESGDALSDAYYVVLDNEGNPKLLDNEGNALSLEDQFLSENVKDVYNALKTELQGVADNSERLTIFKKYMTWYNDDGGSMKSKLGYFIGMGDIKHGYDGNDFPDTAKELYIDYIDNEVYDNGAIKNAFTSYGLHTETISFMPFYKVNLIDLGSGVWALGLDKSLDLENAKFRETLLKSVEDTINTNTYTAWTSAIKKEEADKNSTRAENKLNKLAKELGIER